MREATNATAPEALQLNVIDAVAPTLPSLLEQADGVKTKPRGFTGLPLRILKSTGADKRGRPVQNYETVIVFPTGSFVIVGAPSLERLYRLDAIATPYLVASGPRRVQANAHSSADDPR